MTRRTQHTRVWAEIYTGRIKELEDELATLRRLAGAGQGRIMTMEETLRKCRRAFASTPEREAYWAPVISTIDAELRGHDAPPGPRRAEFGDLYAGTGACPFEMHKRAAFGWLTGTTS
jgi:hypothetical protein